MKMATTVKWIAAMMLAASVTVNAQGPGGGQGGKGGKGGGGPGGQRQRPSPEQMAEQLMAKFDANKDGKLSQDELAPALKALREHRPQGPAGGGQAHGPGEAAQDGPKGQQGPPPAETVAAQMIEKFSSDKKGLTQAELAKALAEHRPNRGQHGGKPQGQGGPKTPPPRDEANNQR